MQHDPVQPRAKRDIGFREFVALCAALMSMNALSIDPMLPALPDIGRALNIANSNDRQMIITVYFMGLGVGSLLFGLLSDRYGRKAVLAPAMVCFMIATVGCAIAESFTMLLVSRAAAGFFAAASRIVTVGIVRDRFRGDAMARVMSLIFSVFMIVPVLAPSFGQAILWVGPWRWIFWALAMLAGGVAAWMLLRMPETLLRCNRLPISLRAVRGTIGTIVFTRSSIGYMVASGIVMSGLIGFILSVQQIFFDIFDAARIFPLAFAVIAASMGVGSLVNGRLVSRFGARRMSHAALVALMLVSGLHVLVASRGWETLGSFILLQSGAMLCIAFTFSNFSSISLEPFARGAGVASSFQAFFSTFVSSLLGGAIGRAFDNTTVPMALGTLLCGALALAIILWAERGRLFTRPGLASAREPVPPA